MCLGGDMGPYMGTTINKITCTTNGQKPNSGSHIYSSSTWKDEQWPDNWTAVTADGKLSAQFEETLLVTDTGVEILTQRNEKNVSNQI
ncbi:Methionine aminopeptidase 1 [Portunus trituberculatus]|uniref:Methionine aminopeptidase 1 n=1 Tax=Portunus trituberculatus TaxID=210409 RepID=A0A5B7GEU2_PORTR|nr:Methionine aminopeptidase 1 [Portunus trituberculatus]